MVDEGRNTWFEKFRRTFTSLLPVAGNRSGGCVGCGACCRLPKKCLFLREGEKGCYCMIYPIRPLNCRRYPRTESEWITKDTCGFKFE
ncbi:MAG TPA: hypothetical protein ENN13_04140 [Candidatus Altiarchaeales archaeon]|nr:hypothetical protein [Candidatus Altiarchaeales archaeon]